MSFLKRPYDSTEGIQHRAVVEEKFATTRKQEVELKGWLMAETSREIREAHGEVWIIFGDKAYKAMCGRFEEGGTIIDYMPAHLDGEYMAAWPDEGSGGVMHVMTIVARGGVIRDEPTHVCATIELGWLKTSELELTRREIHEAVANDQALFG